MRSADLIKRLDDHPFKPFRIHLLDGTQLDIAEPGMVIVARNTAVIPSEFEYDEDGFRIARNWRTVALLHIVQFSDLNGSKNKKRRRGQ